MYLNYNILLQKLTEGTQPWDLVEKIAVNLRHYPINEVLSAPMLVNKFDCKLIKNFLSYLVPTNFRFVLL